MNERLLILRKKLGLTQEQLAQRLSVSVNTVSRWERLKSKPSRLALEKVEALERGDLI